jgi:hypothetical protein
MDRQAYLFYFKNALLWTIFYYRAFGLLGFRTIGPSDYRAFGLLGLRTIGPSDYWAFGLSDFRTIGPTPSINATDFLVVKVYETDFPVVKVHFDELSSARIWQHKSCATLSTNVNINYHLPIKVYYRICTIRHIRIELIHESQNVFCSKSYHSLTLGIKY